MPMNDADVLNLNLAAGIKLLTGMLGLTVALLPAADREIVLAALAALEADNASHLLLGEPSADAASFQAAKALETFIKRFAAEIETRRVEPEPA